MIKKLEENTTKSTENLVKKIRRFIKAIVIIQE